MNYMDEERSAHGGLGAQLNRLSLQQLGRMLSLILLEITIQGRNTYVPNSVEVQDPATLRRLNECQHFVSGILTRVLFDESVDRDALAESLTSLSNDRHVGHSVVDAIMRAMRHVNG